MFVNPELNVSPQNAMRPLCFRRSHLLRIGGESLDDLDRTVEPYSSKRREEMIALNISNIPGGMELLGGLRREYAQLLSELLDEDRSLEESWSIELLRDVAFSQSTKVDAFLEADAGQPRVRISEGLCLALDDTLLSALCVLGFFTARLKQDDVPEVYLIGFCAPENKDKSFDYTRTSQSSSADLPGALTSHIPLDPVRLSQADLLLSFTMHWVSLHEQAHWLLGHMEWLRIERGWSKSSGGGLFTGVSGLLFA